MQRGMMGKFKNRAQSFGQHSFFIQQIKYLYQESQQQGVRECLTSTKIFVNNMILPAAYILMQSKINILLRQHHRLMLQHEKRRGAAKLFLLVIRWVNIFTSHQKVTIENDVVAAVIASSQRQRVS
jgi:hypothetical protein